MVLRRQMQDLMQMAFRSLKNNKFRCFLTMLGIIIGVSSVITMLAIGQGSKRSIQAQISEMGSNVIMVFPGNRRAGGVRLSADEMQTLKLQDYRSIEEKATLLSHVSPMVSSSGQFIYGAKNTPSTLYGGRNVYRGGYKCHCQGLRSRADGGG